VFLVWSKLQTQEYFSDVSLYLAQLFVLFFFFPRFYKGVRIDGDLLQLGDCVYVLPSEKDAAEFIAKYVVALMLHAQFHFTQFHATRRTNMLFHIAHFFFTAHTIFT